MKHPQFSCSLWDEATALPHFWEHTVGSGHASLALRGGPPQVPVCTTKGLQPCARMMASGLLPE
jgi:hypothetical protein